MGLPLKPAGLFAWKEETVGESEALTLPGFFTTGLGLESPDRVRDSFRLVVDIFLDSIPWTDSLLGGKGGKLSF